jgi:hypothetical protein
MSEREIEQAGWKPWRLWVVVIATLVLAGLVLAHVHRVNGPWYWRWSWRRLSFWLYPAMLVAATPFVVAQVIYARRGSRRLAVLCLALATLSLEPTALAFQPPTLLRRLPLIVQNTVITSYYTDAIILHEQKNISTWEWLYQYPDIVPLLHVHAKYKPPGLMLFYLSLVSVFGKGKLAAAIAGSVIALAAAAAVPMTYRMIEFYSDDRDAAFCGASFLALCPSLVLFLPQFDQLYTSMAPGLLLLYGFTVHRKSLRYAIAFGAAMALALFLSYIFMIFGLFFIVYWMIHLADRGAKPALGAAGRIAFAAGMCVGLYAALWAMTGFDPITTFQVIGRVQTIDLLPLIRPFPQHIFDDLLDLALGTGWISFILVGFLVASWGWRIFLGRSKAHRLVQLAMLQILTIAFAALLPGETARLWLPLVPLLMAPIGFELARWPVRQRAAVYACLWILLVVICQNMVFIYMGPELDGPRW